MAWKAVITNAGLALLNQYAQGGHTLNVLGATVASGTVAEANMRIQTALTTEKDNASIISAKVVTGGVKYKIQVTAASASVGAYTAHQIGLWAKLDSNGARTLLALAQDADNGVGIPLASVSPNFAFALFIAVGTSNTEDLTVEIDSTTFVTLGTMEDAIDEAIGDALDGVLTEDNIDDTAGAGDTDKLWSADKLAGALAAAGTVKGVEVNGTTISPDNNGIVDIGHMLTGTGTAGQAGSSSADYVPSLWTFNTGHTPEEGDVVTIKVPVAGVNSGVWMSVDNGASYFPVAAFNKTRYTTQYDAGSTVTLVYQKNIVTSIYGTSTSGAAAGASVADYTSDRWCLVNGYDANTTYTNMSASEFNTGTATTGRLVSAATLKKLKSNNLSLTLASGSWSSATPPTQTITATGVTASNNIIVGIGSGITSEQYDAACAAKIVCTAQGANSITLTCYGDEPTVNIPISVVILG